MKPIRLTHQVLTFGLLLASPAISQAVTPAQQAPAASQTGTPANNNTAIPSPQSPEKWLQSQTALTPAERDAMKFLYSYMVLADRGGYTPDFYLENVRSSLRAREEMPWGKTVPEREFRHFVLPIRVNNENLDLSRPVFYEELKERVRGLSMEEAILEVNHWCHEKATYQPSDARTSSPLSTVSQAIGRCGEESTFAVAALRSVGIPARQVYTPRWAHTDDNHAWVEAWANGRWYFIGACEPEPILNLAWFNSPASRGMLMNTKVFGDYDGPEEVLERTPTNTIINVTSNYAPVHTVDVVVRDTSGAPVENATVNFSLYNYAEFYPVAKKKTDSSGRASLNGGMGDFIVWASDGTNFGIAQASPSAKSPVTVTLDKGPDWTGVMEFDIVPPMPSASLPTPTAAQREANNRRIAFEDSIRMAYVATFATPESAGALAAELGVDPGRLTDILVQSRGNHSRIADFLRGLPAASREKALRLLQAVSEKDRRDITADVLADHLSTPDTDSPLFDRYVMNPRIENEGLTPYKSFLASAIPAKLKADSKADPSKWVGWCRDSIAVDTVWNQLGIRMSPESVWRLRRADSRSRDIFFVAGARSMGIPSRIDPITGKTQYAGADGDWIDVKFADEPAAAPVRPKGSLILDFTPVGRTVDPKYYSQFSLSAIRGGLPALLEFDEGETASGINAKNEPLDCGRYALVSGQRMSDGSVLARAEFFNIVAGERTRRPLIIRQDSTQIQVLGSFNSENLYHDLADSTNRSLLSTTGRGYYILGLIQPNHEPTSHNLNDISAVASEFEKWGKKIILLFADADEAARFDRSRFPSLPSNVVFGTDIDGTNLAEIVASLNLPTSERPVFIVADTFNRVVFVSQGYTIGLGETLTDIIHRVRD